MTMNINKPQAGFDISYLVDDLEPIKPLRFKTTLLVLAGLSILALFAISFMRPLREDLLLGQPTAMFLMRSGMLALLGGATAFSVLAMARPSVGKHSNSWQIALSFAAIFPLGGMIAIMTGDDTLSIASTASVYRCLGFSTVAALATSIPIILSLRRGAPTNPTLAGWLTGIAAGGMGSFSYSFYCPFDSLAYTGVWFTLAVGISAVAGRLIVPRLIRW
jgi:hypothetical protein